ncbi:hypothetical protein KPL40_05365 [Clostridium gasigenes]|uniref:hypothetical protein n=1 Tax=Clostridium gasigenes TaxID=94869 RepID=UPI001C0D9077|nr:hypothetical protein [Clostridium gasigenes]MBU3131875.1 hypothetical protein [Clostridium gasigenes]
MLNFDSDSSKGNRGALDQLGKELEQAFKRKGKVISEDEGKIIDEWANEYGVSQHHGVQDGSGQHWEPGFEHTHIGGKHIPYK